MDQDENVCQAPTATSAPEQTPTPAEEPAPAPAAVQAQGGPACGTPYAGMYDGPGTGLASDESAARFAQATQQVNLECLDPLDRVQALHDEADKSLNDAGVPSTTLNVDPTMDDGNNASFDGPSWQMNVNPSRFTDEKVENPTDAADSTKTLYHESRHAEQSYRVAELQSGEGETPDEVPPAIGQQAAQTPTLQSDAQSAQTESWIHTGDEATHVDWAEGNKAPQTEYCEIPEEADAWGTAAKVVADYPGGADERHREQCYIPPEQRVCGGD